MLAGRVRISYQSCPCERFYDVIFAKPDVILLDKPDVTNSSQKKALWLRIDKFVCLSPPKINEYIYFPKIYTENSLCY